MRRSTAARIAVVVIALVAVVGALVIAGAPRSTSAHAFLQSSSPAANAVIAVAPTSVTMTFTEPLERASSRASLFDVSGQEMPAATFRAGADEYAMVLNLPPSLPNGTYTVAWETLSTVDGHSAQGFIPFTIGSSADVQTVIPPVVSTVSGPPLWLSSLSRWTALLGLAVTVAVWPIWLLVLRPGISPAWQAGPALTRRVKRIAAGGVGLALLGSLFTLLVQAESFGSGDGYLTDLTSTLTETRYGRVWLIRVGLLLVMGAILTLVGWWWPRRTRVLTLAGLALGAALPIPYSEISHAAALSSGRGSAIAFDVVHLLGASMWVGGLAVLVLALVPSLRDLTPAGRRVVLGRVLPRFSAVALVAWGVLGLSGLYSAWLHVGNLRALRDTDYGRSLLWKLLLLVPLLALGAYNLLVVTRRVRAAGRDTARVNTWSSRFGWVITAELVLVVVLFLVVGRLTGQAPAREELALGNGRATIALAANDQNATLIITPASAGPNHYRLEFAGEPLPGDASALLRIDLPSQGSGQTDIPLIRAAGNAFEGHGSDLSITGDWTIQTILIQPGRDDWTTTSTLAIGSNPPQVDLPAPAWRFGTTGIFGLVLVVLGGAGFVIAWFVGRAPLRRESAGLGTVAMVAGLILLMQARTDDAGATLAGGPSVNPMDANPASIARGQQTYLANCVACHGAAGRGDGQQAASLATSPADLTSSHARSHRDEDLYYWIENGIVGSAMPPFGETLGDDEIWDTVNYLRSLQNATERDIPQPEDCTVAPKTIDELQALADPNATDALASDLAAASTPAALPSGTPADGATVTEITGAVRQLVACSNARDPLRRLALFTDDSLRPNFTQGPTDTFIRLTGTPPVALPPEIRVSIVAISDVQTLPDGRVRATVAADNPATHAHGPNGEELPGQQSLEVVTLVFERQGDRWLIADQRG